MKTMNSGDLACALVFCTVAICVTIVIVVGIVQTKRYPWDDAPKDDKKK